jgi:hypothetical protein
MINDLKLPKWPISRKMSDLDNIDGNLLLKYSTIVTDTTLEFNSFKGAMINYALDFENCMDYIILEILAGKNKIKKQLLYNAFWVESNFGFNSKFKAFKSLILFYYQFDDRLLQKMRNILELLEYFIKFRNALAHHYLSHKISVVEGNKIKIEVFSEGQSLILFTNEFTGVCRYQSTIIEMFFNYLYLHLKHKSNLNKSKNKNKIIGGFKDIRFFKYIGNLTPEQVEKEKDKETTSKLNFLFKTNVNPSRKKGVFSIRKEKGR